MKPVRISVVIVSYNVRFFLEQCLRSVYRAGRGIPMEVFVVDNNSADGSCAMVRSMFPEVILIENRDNTGFSKANNQAMRIAGGEYQLILNPDTVVEETTFQKVLEFLDAHPEAGALGVRMIDGKGRFLPESKRALPTPWVSFYKIFGLSALFPRSRRFGQYHLGYLPQDQTNQVEILPGAFMCIRKEVLDKIGYFDEAFFMYGEDIDLSYRIIQAGYKNYYFPETTIIHYKGESTKKASINYVVMFYQAMIIFATKHFSASNARWFSFFIRLSVYFRAAVSMARRVAYRLVMPLADAGLAFLGFVLISPAWESYKFPEGGHYPPEFLMFYVPACILAWLIATWFAGGYDFPVRPVRILRGIVYGTAAILVLYSLLPEAWRFSRALILIGSAWTLGVIMILRFLLHLTGINRFRLDIGRRKRLVIIGLPEEANRVSNLIAQTDHPLEVFGYVAPGDQPPVTGNYLGSVNQLAEIIRINRIDELIFCSKDLSANEIIKQMLSLSALGTEYKIAPEESESIIGSNSSNTSGDLYVIPIGSVGEPGNRRIKRLFDISASLLMIALSPLLVWFFLPKPWLMIWRCLVVLSGNRTWVGYHPDGITPGYHLPPLKKGVLHPESGANPSRTDRADWLETNLQYARNYKMMKDLNILVRGYRSVIRVLTALALLSAVAGITGRAAAQDFRDQINLMRPLPENCLVYGVLSAPDKRILPDTRISLLDLRSHEVKESILTDRNAWFLFTVRKGSPFALIIERDGYFPYYSEKTVPGDYPEMKMEIPVTLPDDLRKEFTVYFPAGDTVLGENSRVLITQLAGILKKQPLLSAWFDPQGDSLDFLKVNHLTALFAASGIPVSRLLTGEQPGGDETFIRIEIGSGPGNAVPLIETGTGLPEDDRWTIQFAASKSPLAKKSFKGLDPVFEFRGRDGFYRYAYGSFKNKEEATRKIQSVKRKGFPKPFAKTVESIRKL